MRPLLTTIAQGLPDTVPFTGPEALERRTAVPFRARVGANESGFGPSPKVIHAVREMAPEMWMYGDPEVFELKAALAAKLGVPAANVAVGEGIDGLHGLIARLVIEPGDVAVTSLGAYPTFNYHVAGFGGQIAFVPYTGYREDLGALAEAARRERAKVIYLSNPDNPMGTWWSAAEISAFIGEVPEETLVLLDEAYCETAPANTLSPLYIDRPNLIRTRTFSKAYGLAGMRIGYAIGEAGFIKAFDKVRNHFGVTRASQVAAIAALGDDEWLRSVVERVGRGAAAALCNRAGKRTRFGGIGDQLRRHRLRARWRLRGEGAEGTGTAWGIRAEAECAGLDQHIRISVGPEPEMDVVAAELPQALRDAAEA